MSRLEHVAIWVKDIETMKSFYVKYFQGKAGEIYHNPTKQYYSYFISFDSGTRIELMQRADISDRLQDSPLFLGITHLAFSVDSKERVDALTEQLRTDGYKIVSGTRTTGDGYYESSVYDPENNLIEITL